ncbi:hypothetical protein GCM10009813_17940 [Brevibacterium marinum]
MWGRGVRGRPALPTNNNYKVFANGGKEVGYRFNATARLRRMPNSVTVARPRFKTVSTSRG